jgi:hypothetical protein
VTTEPERSATIVAEHNPRRMTRCRPSRLRPRTHRSERSYGSADENRSAQTCIKQPGGRLKATSAPRDRIEEQVRICGAHGVEPFRWKNRNRQTSESAGQDLPILQQSLGPTRTDNGCKRSRPQYVIALADDHPIMRAALKSALPGR